METVGPDRAAAVALLEERRVVVRKGWRRPTPQTFGEAFCKWFADPAVSGTWKSSTRAQYVSIRRRLVQHFGPVRLGQLRPSDVVSYRTRRLEERHPDGRQRFAAATVSRDMSILHAFLAWAVVQEYVDRNVADGVKHPSAARRKGNALRPEDVQALLRGFDHEQDALVFLTLVLTGVRRAELQALRWANVDLIENRLRVVDSKTETGERVVAIPPVLAERLWQHRRTSSYRADSDRVFCHPQAGTVYRYETFAAALQRAYTAAGMVFPVGMRPFHDLRVTSITNDAIAGANPVALMTKAGHASMQTTRRYLRLAGTVFPEEAAALEGRLLGALSTNRLPDSADLSLSRDTVDGLNAPNPA